MPGLIQHSTENIQSLSKRAGLSKLRLLVSEQICAVQAEYYKYKWVNVHKGEQIFFLLVHTKVT